MKKFAVAMFDSFTGENKIHVLQAENSTQAKTLVAQEHGWAIEGNLSDITELTDIVFSEALEV